MVKKNSNNILDFFEALLGACICDDTGRDSPHKEEKLTSGQNNRPKGFIGNACHAFIPNSEEMLEIKQDFTEYNQTKRHSECGLGDAASKAGDFFGVHIPTLILDFLNIIYSDLSPYNKPTSKETREETIKNLNNLPEDNELKEKATKIAYNLGKKGYNGKFVHTNIASAAYEAELSNEDLKKLLKITREAESKIENLNNLQEDNKIDHNLVNKDHNVHTNITPATHNKDLTREAGSKKGKATRTRMIPCGYIDPPAHFNSSYPERRYNTDYLLPDPLRRICLTPNTIPSKRYDGTYLPYSRNNKLPIEAIPSASPQPKRGMEGTLYSSFYPAQTSK